MKKIIFLIVEKSNDDPTKIFLETNKNTLLNYRNKNFFFDSKYNEPEKIIVNFQHLVFDKNLYDKLVEIKKISIYKASTISGKALGKEIPDGSLNGIIYSQITKSYYEKPCSIFNFCSRLFVKILMEHKLVDGNKRLAISFLITMLRYFGYHLDWSEGMMQNYKYYESQIEKFVKKLQKGYNDSDIKEMEKWIQKHSVIAIEWR